MTDATPPSDIFPPLQIRDELERFFQRRKLPLGDMRAVRNGVFQLHLDYAQMEVTEATKAACKEHFPIPTLEILERQDSRLDNSSKLLLGTRDGLKIETVIMRAGTGRTTLCISSQVGCTEKCSFCSTGRLGFKRNLSTAEILAQVVTAGRILASEGRRPRNVVFMGMGEPLRNQEAVEEAVALLVNPVAFALSPSRVTVSSLGLPKEMIAFAARFPQVRLALSLHAADDETRTPIMPITQRHNLAELRAAMVRIQEIRQSDLLIQFTLFRDRNDSEEHALRLVEFLQGLDTHINLIPYNASDSRDVFQPTLHSRMLRFQEILQEKGFKVTRRYSFGQDIAAACGQLANKSS
jgi:23S rRNA (adenine2503-C2)-methyltransferase